MIFLFAPDTRIVYKRLMSDAGIKKREKDQIIIKFEVHSRQRQSMQLNDVNHRPEVQRVIYVITCHMDIQKVCSNWNAYLKQVRWELEAVPCSMYWFLHGITNYSMYSHRLSALWHLSLAIVINISYYIKITMMRGRTISFCLYLNKLCHFPLLEFVFQSFKYFRTLAWWFLVPKKDMFRR